MATEARKDEARDAIEAVINQFEDVFVSDPDDEYTMAMPLLGHWCLIMTHDDAQDPTLISGYEITRKNQATHETVGLLWLALKRKSEPGTSD
jgi:hypothetical protein